MSSREQGACKDKIAVTFRPEVGRPWTWNKHHCQWHRLQIVNINGYAVYFYTQAHLREACTTIAPGKLGFPSAHPLINPEALD